MLQRPERGRSVNVHIKLKVKCIKGESCNAGWMKDPRNCGLLLLFAQIVFEINSFAQPELW